MFAVPVLLLLVSCCFAIFLRLKLKHFTLVGPAVTNFNFKVTDLRAFMTSLLQLTSSNERLNNVVVHISIAYSICLLTITH